MATVSIKFRGDTKRFEKFLKSEATFKILEQEIGKATARNAALLQDAIVEKILSKRFKKKNSPLTKALKDSDTPLVNTGELAKAVEVELSGSFVAFVGFLRNQKMSNGGDLKKIVPLLEKGFEVKITKRMRKWLFLKMRELNIPEGPRTSSGGVLRVPARPFISPIFRSRRMRTKLNANWKAAIERAFKRLGAL